MTNRPIPDEEVRLIGNSAAIRAIKDEIDQAARTDAKVLITGETGVGKEVLARLIHHRSARALAPLVTVNCAGLPDELLESELFGHVRGSFTGAHRDTVGLVDQAPNGTLFLDEVGEMSPRMQGVLLRFLESGEVQRVGDTRVHLVTNVRIVAATNRDLTAQIAAGRFREDLHFRLNVIGIEVPPLRHRPTDIPLLIDSFLARYAHAYNAIGLTMSPMALTALMDYQWPGNVRELRNIIERAVVRTKGPVILVEDLPFEVRPRNPDEMLPVEPAPGSVTDESARNDTQSLALTMVDGRESFWSAVHPQFMSRDLTRSELRRIIHLGLTETNGDYRGLVDLFNMPTGDYRRFVGFLRTHDCYLHFVPDRVGQATDPLRTLAAS